MSVNKLRKIAESIKKISTDVNQIGHKNVVRVRSVRTKTVNEM